MPNNKKKVMDAFESFFKKLWEYLKNFKKPTVLDEMKEAMEGVRDQLEEIADKLDDEEVEKFIKITKEMEGKLETSDSMEMEDSLNEFIDKANRFMEDVVKADTLEQWLGMAVFASFGNELSLKEGTLLTDKDGEVYICSEDKVGKFTLKKKEDENTYVIGCQVLSPEDVYEKGKLKEGFETLEASPEEKYLKISELLFSGTGIKIAKNEEEQYRLIEEKMTPEERRMLFYQSRLKTVLTENGRYESKYFSEDNSFRIRDTETGELIVSRSGKDSLRYFFCKESNSLEDVHDEIDAGGYTGDYSQSEQRIISDFEPRKGSLTLNAMLKTSEFSKWLSINGVIGEFQKRSLNDRTEKLQCRVSKEGLKNVHEFKNVLINQIKENTENSYKITVPNTRNTFINIERGGNSASITFTRDGLPNGINFRTKNDEKFKYVCNFNSKNVSSEFKNYRDMDEFKEILHIAEKSFEQFSKTEQTKAKDKKQTEIER